MKTAEEMKKQISLFVEYKDHDRVILSNANGDAFSSKSEDLIDFLHGIKDSQASDLPSDGITKFTEKEIDAAKSVRDSFLNQAGVERYKQVYMAGEIVMSDQLQPILASHVARILELEEAGNQILKWYDDENDSKAHSTEQWQKAYNQLRKALTPPKP